MPYRQPIMNAEEFLRANLNLFLGFLDLVLALLPYLTIVSFICSVTGYSSVPALALYPDLSTGGPWFQLNTNRNPQFEVQ